MDFLGSYFILGQEIKEKNRKSSSHEGDTCLAATYILPLKRDGKSPPIVKSLGGAQREMPSQSEIITAILKNFDSSNANLE